MVVADLWTTDGKCWDTRKVRSLFLPFEQDRILNMRISKTKPEDTWMWDLETHGEYSVKSAYKALTNNGDQGACSSNVAAEKGLWNCIWSAGVLPRVKVFMWQMCNNAIPTRFNLASRIRSSDASCPVCFSEMETCLHFAGGCGLAGGFWDRAGLELRSIVGYEHVREWVEDVWRELGSEEVNLFMMGCWALWEARNKVVFKNEIAYVHNVWRRVEDLRWELCALGNGDESGEPKQGMRDRWVKPEEGRVKLNVDAGVKDGVGMGMGMVCRDSTGRVLWGMHDHRSTTPDPRMAEAEAMLEGITEARRRGHSRIIIESDCKTLIEALEKRSSGRSEFHLIVDEILCVCSCFELVVWSFVSRKLNRVAHALARLGSLYGCKSFQGDTFPENVMQLVCDDLTDML